MIARQPADEGRLKNENVLVSSYDARTSCIAKLHLPPGGSLLGWIAVFVAVVVSSFMLRL
jgi:hypothetical protein